MRKLNGVFDNRETMQREAWSDGEIAAMWPAVMCEDMTQTLIPWERQILRSPGVPTPIRPKPRVAVGAYVSTQRRKGRKGRKGKQKKGNESILRFAIRARQNQRGEQRARGYGNNCDRYHCHRCDSFHNRSPICLRFFLRPLRLCVEVESWRGGKSRGLRLVETRRCLVRTLLRCRHFAILLLLVLKVVLVQFSDHCTVRGLSGPRAISFAAIFLRPRQPAGRFVVVDGGGHLSNSSGRAGQRGRHVGTLRWRRWDNGVVSVRSVNVTCPPPSTCL